jgi:arylformamidase
MSKLIDLSVLINNNTPVYPGDPKVVIEQAGELTQDGYSDQKLTMGNHVGTHLDAPAHMVAGGKTLDQFPIDRFVGRGVLIEGFDLETIQQKDLQPGDVVLFMTGMSEKYHDADYFHDYPAMPDEAAAYLASKKVSMVGVDTGSVDNQDKFPIHKSLLQNEVLIIENLTNLKELMGKEFRVIALPLRLEVDGAPARVVAEITE